MKRLTSIGSLISNLRSIESVGDGWDNANFVDVDGYENDLILAQSSNVDDNVPFGSSQQFSTEDISMLLSSIAEITASNKIEMHLSEQEAIATQTIEEILRFKAANPGINRYVLPEHLEIFKRGYERIAMKPKSLPTLNLLSPRTKKRIAQLPQPNASEIELIEKRQQEIRSVNPKAVYKGLIESTHAARGLAHRRHQKEMLEVELERQQKLHAIPTKPMFPEDKIELDTSSAEFFEKVAQRKKRLQDMERFGGSKDNKCSTPKSMRQQLPSLVSKAANLLESPLVAMLEKGRPSSGAGAEPKRKGQVAPLTDEVKGKGSVTVNLGEGAAAVSGSETSPLLMNTAVADSSCTAKLGASRPLKSVQSAPSLTSLHLTANSSPPYALESDQAHEYAIQRSAVNNQVVAAAGAAGVALGASPPPKKTDGPSQRVKNLHVAYSSAESATVEAMPLGALVAPLPAVGSTPSWARDQNVADVPLADAYAPVLKTKTETAQKVLQGFTESLQEHERVLRAKEKVDTQHSNYVDDMKVHFYENMGLDVDKDFNKRRLFGKATKCLLYSVYSLRTKMAFERFHSQAVLATKALRARCGLIMTRVVRGFVARRFVRAKRHMLELQKEAERLAEEAHQAKLNAMASLLTWALRWKLVRTRIARRSAAVAIQRLIRGAIARERVRILRAWLKLRWESALTIQCAWRQRLARRKVRLARKLEFVRTWMVHMEIEGRAKGLLLAQNGASSHIAAAYRAFVIKKKIKKMIFWHHMELAVHLQRRFRGYSQRKKFKKMKRDKLKREKRQREASLLLQKIVRIFLAKCKLQRLRRIKLDKFEERKRRKQQLLEDFKKDKYNKRIRDLKRRLDFFRTAKENSSATMIQAVFRGHHARKRVYVMRVRTFIKSMQLKDHKRHLGATAFQRMWRGFVCRLKIKRKRRRIMVVRIQCWWRGILAKRIFCVKKNNFRASKTMYKFVLHYTRQRLQRKKRQFKRKFIGPAIKIQRFVRRCLGRLRSVDRKYALRVNNERVVVSESLLAKVMWNVQLRIVQDSMNREIGVRPPSLSTASCPCYGPVQAMFVAAIGPKGRTDFDALVINKIDSISLSKFLAKIEGLIQAEKQRGSKRQSSTKPSPTITTVATTVASKGKILSRDKLQMSRTISQSKRPSSLLFEAVESKLFETMPAENHITPTELDLCFAKSKSAVATGNHLGFDEFITCLRSLAELRFTPHNERKHNTKGRAAKKAKSNFVEQQAAPLEADEASLDGSVDDNSNHSMSEVTDRKAQMLRNASSLTLIGGSHSPTRRQRSEFDDPARLVTHIDALRKREVEDNKLLALCVFLMTSERTKPWMEAVMKWMDTESRMRIGRFVIRIQSVLRRKHAYIVFRRLQEERLQEEANKEFTRKLKRVQACWRRFIYRRRVIRMAQKFLIKYVPFEGKSYWYNPSTRMSTWTKPKILGDFECVSLAVPTPGLEAVVRCSICLQSATLNCQECEESYCRDCYESTHCKGRRKLHHKIHIPRCSYCTHQVATKNCLTCVLAKPKLGTAQVALAQSARGLYCDSCFVHSHDRMEEYLEKNADRKKAERDLLFKTTDAYLVKQQMHHVVDTKHKFDSLIQTCEECHWRGAAWRCLDCVQLYCHTCLIGLHSMGGTFGTHAAEPLPYYTCEMHKSYQSDWQEKKNQKKTEYLSRLAAKRKEEIRYAALMVIQRWWRGRWYGRHGRKHLKAERRKLRRAYRLRKREDLEIRSQRGYKINDYFGRAPLLASDTQEEKVLKGFTKFFGARKRAKRFIKENKADWGFYRVSRTDPQKGDPKTGFAVGTLEELQDQALRGGYRMPGGIYMEKGMKRQKTVTDLSNILKEGDIVRVLNKLYFVTEVADCTVTLDEKWYNESLEEPVVLYRMPTYIYEQGNQFCRYRISARAFYYRNAITQGYVRNYIALMGRIVKYSRFMAKASMAGGSIEDSRAWRETAIKYAKRAKAKQIYLLHDESKVGEDLEGDDARIELEKKKKNEDGDSDSEAEFVAPADGKLFNRKKGERWIATPEEFNIRKAREELMTPEELAAEADVWEENFDPLTEEVFYVHKETCEVIYGFPRSVASKKLLEENAEKNRIMAEEAKKRVDKLTGKSKMKLGAKKR